MFFAICSASLSLQLSPCCQCVLDAVPQIQEDRSGGRIPESRRLGKVQQELIICPPPGRVVSRRSPGTYTLDPSQFLILSVLCVVCLSGLSVVLSRLLRSDRVSFLGFFRRAWYFFTVYGYSFVFPSGKKGEGSRLDADASEKAARRRTTETLSRLCTRVT